MRCEESVLLVSFQVGRIIKFWRAILVQKNGLLLKNYNYYYYYYYYCSLLFSSLLFSSLLLSSN
jgi:hypothetical protein